jgi:hypothetical protein
VREEATEGPAGAVELAEIKGRWDEVIAQLRKMKRTAEAAFLRDSVPVALEDGTLVLSVERVFGSKVRVTCRMGAGQPDTTEVLPGQPRQDGPKTDLEDVLSMFPGSEVEE